MEKISSNTELNAKCKIDEQKKLLRFNPNLISISVLSTGRWMNFIQKLV